MRRQPITYCRRFKGCDRIIPDDPIVSRYWLPIHIRNGGVIMVAEWSGETSWAPIRRYANGQEYAILQVASDEIRLRPVQFSS